MKAMSILVTRVVLPKCFWILVMELYSKESMALGKFLGRTHFTCRDRPLAASSKPPLRHIDSTMAETTLHGSCSYMVRSVSTMTNGEGFQKSLVPKLSWWAFVFEMRVTLSFSENRRELY